MQYNIKTQDDYSIVKLSGEVDLNFSPMARKQILEQLQGQKHTIVDLGGVDYMDSSGIASLVEGFQYARTHHLKFGLACIQDSVMQVLRLARLDQVFPIFDSVDSCISSNG